MLYKTSVDNTSYKNMTSFLIDTLLLTICFILLNNKIAQCGRTDWTIEQNATFWREHARLSIEEAIKRTTNTRVAKNVILFLGDGMGMSTVTAGRIRKGQLLGQLGEDFITEMEQFTHFGLAKTYVKKLKFDFRFFQNNHLAIILIIRHLIQQRQQQLFYVV